MKKILNSLAALASVMFAGCVQDLSNDLVDSSGNQTVVTIGLEQTKTSLGELVDGTRKVYWSEGDQIAINGVASTSIKIAEGNTRADFTFDGTLNRPYSILYPAADYVDAGTINLPAVQAAATSTFATDCAPMAGYAEAGDALQLHHLAAVVRLQVKLPSESEHADCILKKVEFKGRSGEQVSGTFAIDYKTSKLTSASQAEADKVVTTMVQKELSIETTDVFVVVPAQEYADGFSVRLIDAEGHYMDISSKPYILANGEVKAMPPFEFVPTGTVTEVEIASASDLVAFAKAYNAEEYGKGENLNVALSADIVFDDENNAAWEPIGTSSVWFGGTFDGRNHSIKNWVSSRPLFHATYAGGRIENLIIDSSCELTAIYADASVYYGSIIRYHRGILYNCHNNAAVTVSGKWDTDSEVGGLVGRITNGGKIERCSMTGDMTADETVSVGGNIYLAGIVGYIANEEGMISDTDFTGDLTVNYGSTGSSKSAYVGGIAGSAAGTIEGCSTAENKSVHAERLSNNIANFYLGGIVGYARQGSDIEGCGNYSTVYFKYPRGSKGANRYAYVGGVAGAIADAVSLRDCDNANSVQSYSAYRYVYIGGVVGNAAAESIVDNCHNAINGEIKTGDYGSDYNGAEQLYMGGVIGSCGTSTVSNISNAAKVDMNCVQADPAVCVNVGGCIGYLTASIDGQNAISNNGIVTATDASTDRSYLALGGVVGCVNKADVTLSNVSNTGNVTDAVSVVHKNAFSGGVVGLVRDAATVENVTNGGKVHFSNTESLQHVNTALGGIVGGISALKDNNFAVIVKSSINNGEVSRVATPKASQNSSMICGGIVGILKGDGSSVMECTNNGIVRNECLNSTMYDDTFDPLNEVSSLAVGGVVGFGLGSDGVVTVSGCTNTAECYSARGYTGGITGYVRKASITFCEHNTSTAKGNNYNTRVGGIAGYISASSVTSCDVKSAVETGSNNGCVGGVCGGMDVTSSIVSSTFNGAIKSAGNTKAGAIVALSVTGSNLNKCGAKGTINGAPIGLENFDASAQATQTDSSLME